MKRIMSVVALAAGVILSAYAAGESNNPFQSANEKFAKRQWHMANWRKAKIKVSQKDGKQVFKAEPDDPKIDGAVYCSDKIKVQPGQKIQISIKAAGHGKINLAVWCYDAKKKFIGTRGTPKALTGDSQNVIVEVQIPKNTDYVWPALHIAGGAEAAVEQLEYRIQEQKSR